MCRQMVGRERKDTGIKRGKVGRSCPALTRPDAGVFIHKSEADKSQVFYAHSELEGKGEKANLKMVLLATGCAEL